MDAVIFDGKEYTKASVLAERFNYTQDYLGQLCRAKKVDARLVGRAWYINLQSIEKHRSSRYKVEEKKEIQTQVKKPLNNYLSRIDVEPILRKKTVKVVLGESGKFNEVAVKYESDDYSLIPRVHKEAVDAFIPILPADSEKLAIKTEKSEKTEQTKFKAEPLPEVYLKGSLTVEGMQEALEEIDEAPAQKPPMTVKIQPRQEHKVPVRLKIPLKNNPAKTLLSERPAVRPLNLPVEAVAVPQKTVVAPKPSLDVKRTVQFAPDNIKQAQKPISNPKNKTDVRASIPFATSKALAVVLVGLAVGTASLAFTSHGELAQGEYSEKITFDVKNLSALLQLSIAKISR